MDSGTLPFDCFIDQDRCHDTAHNPYHRDAWTRPITPPLSPAKSSSRNPRQKQASVRYNRTHGSHRTIQRCDASLSGIRRRFVHQVAVSVLGLFFVCALIQSASIYAKQFVASDSDDLPSVLTSSLPEKATGEPQSTPQSQWRAGELPYLYQIDAQFADAPYAGATVGESGCGPTSLAMVYVALTGKSDMDPAAMARFSEEHGFVEEGLTAWRLMTEGAALIGLESNELPADASVLRSELAEGHPVICTVRPGDFTDTGHFLVIAGLSETGELIIHDPNSPANSARTWDIDRVLSQCANLWAFERA